MPASKKEFASIRCSHLTATKGQIKMKKIYLSVVIMLLAGCSTAPPAIQEGPNAEVSYDGLHAIDNSVFALAWADPDIDFSRYSKIMPGGAVLEFRAVKKSSGTQRALSSQSEFYIDDKSREKLAEVASEVFKEELAKSTRFTVAEATGPDVLVIRGALTDIVSNVPPQTAGRSEVFLSQVGEITLILEAVDSMSGEVIFRAMERRALDQNMGGMRSSSVNTWSEVRRLMRRWATTLREGLDSIPEA
jgi:hypothetical protein